MTAVVPTCASPPISLQNAHPLATPRGRSRCPHPSTQMCPVMLPRVSLGLAPALQDCARCLPGARSCTGKSFGSWRLDSVLPSALRLLGPALLQQVSSRVVTLVLWELADKNVPSLVTVEGTRGPRGKSSPGLRRVFFSQKAGVGCGATCRELQALGTHFQERAMASDGTEATFRQES